MRMRWAHILLAAATASVLLLTACGRGGPERGREPDALSIGTEATPVNTLIYIAEERGYFADNDLDVTITDDYASGAQATEALIAGEVDISTSAELGLVRHAIAGRRIVTHASIDEFLHQYLVGRKDRGIAEPEDILGKTVGVPLGTGAEFNFDRFLDLRNIDKEQVTIVDVQAPDSVAALTAGTVDAVVAWQPNVATLLTSMGTDVASWSVQNEQPTFCLTITDAAWARENQEVMDRFLRALAQAEDFTVEQPEEARSLIQNRLGYDDAYMNQIWPEHEFALSLNQSLILALEDQARWLLGESSAETTPVPDFSNYVEIEPLRRLRPESVNVVR